MKRIFLALLVLSACNGTPGTAPEQQNVATVKAMFDAFNAHDWEKMASYYAENAQFLDPSFGTEYVAQTRAETSAKNKEMEQMFPNVHDEVLGLYPSGDKVFVEFVSTGTAADGSSFRLPIACVLTISDGKIVRDATYYNNAQP